MRTYLSNFTRETIYAEPIGQESKEKEEGAPGTSCMASLHGMQQRVKADSWNDGLYTAWHLPRPTHAVLLSALPEW